MGHPDSSNPGSDRGSLNLPCLFFMNRKREEGHFYCKYSMERETSVFWIPSCLLCLNNGRTCIEKLIVSLELHREVGCSLLHEELLAVKRASTCAFLAS